jgi:hypothetical protein
LPSSEGSISATITTRREKLCELEQHSTHFDRRAGRVGAAQPLLSATAVVQMTSPNKPLTKGESLERSNYETPLHSL